MAETGEPLAVKGTRRTMRELVDGTLRVQVDIEPREAKTFLALFPSVDMELALAPMRTPAQLSAAQAQEEAARKAAREQAKGQRLSMYAAMLCQKSDFHEFLHDTRPARWAELDACTAEEAAAVIVREVCGVKSRAELDRNQKAEEAFHEHIRRPFFRWAEANA